MVSRGWLAAMPERSQDAINALEGTGMGYDEIQGRESLERWIERVKEKRNGREASEPFTV